MIKKSILSILLILLFLTGCSKNAEQETITKGSVSSAAEKTYKVALITASGGLGDRSFNDSAFTGVLKAEKDFNIELKVIEPQGIADYQNSINLASKAGYELVIAVGNDWSDAITTVAPNYPDVKYGAINLGIELDNLQVYKFADNEGSFLAGALAGYMTETNKIGYIGGLDVPAIKRFLMGYEQGAKYVNPDVEVIPTFVGSFADPFKGKEFSLQLMNEGCDVIYHGAGKSAEGLIEAAKERDDVYLIGCDQNQDSVIEGRVLSSMIKHVEVATYSMVESFINGNYQAGTVSFGIEDGGVGLSDMQYTRDLITEEVIDELKLIEEKIISGEIKVNDISF